MSRNLKAAVVAGVLALAAPAASALGAEFTVSLSPQSDAVVGRPMVIQATGTIPPEYVQYLNWFSAGVIPTSVMSTCPDDHWAAWQVAQTAGVVLSLTQREHPDATGNFSLPVAFTPWAPGSYLVCAYTDDGYTNTLALGSLALTVQPGAPPPTGSQPPPPSGGPPATAAAPANVRKPRVTRSGKKLVCNAGGWRNEPTGYSYRWLAGGKLRKDGRTLAVARVHGRNVRCSVTASNAAGTATAVSRPLRVA